MRLGSLKIPLFFFVLGFGWVIGNDPFITFLSKILAFGIDDSIRVFIDFVFILLASVYLYYHISREQKKLNLSEKQYRSLFIGNPNPMWIYQIGSLKFVEVNDAAIAKYGYSREEFLQMTIKDIRPTDEVDKLLETIKSRKTGLAYSFLWQHIIKSGKVIIVSVTSNRLSFNGMACSMVMSTDVTDLINNKRDLEKAYQTERKLNDALEENLNLIKQANYRNHRMAEVINKINNLVVIVSRKGVITWVNQAFIDFTGYSLEDVKGSPGAMLFGPKTDLSKIKDMADTLQEGKFFSTELVNYKKNKDEYWSQIHISPIFDQDGKFDFFVSVENVITERKEKEERLNAQYLAFREIAWTNSHEIRKPLASILSLTSLLKEADTPEVRDELLGLIHQSTTDLDSLIKENSKKINAMEDMVNPSPFKEESISNVTAL